MRTIGQILKDYRKKKKYSFEKVERLTKIKKNFLQSIEKEEWNKLPEYPVVAGFVRSFAGVIGANKDHMVATLRRDYPPKKISVNPKPDIAKSFSWSPKLTSVVVTVFAVLLIFSYLVIQYINFSKNPNIEVIYPQEGEVVLSTGLKVRGKVDNDVTVYVNNQPALISDNGDFETEIEISENTDEVTIKAISRAGKETIITRKIRVDLSN
jgi:cytoskeletal protein RodZ